MGGIKELATASREWRKMCLWQEVPKEGKTDCTRPPLHPERAALANMLANHTESNCIGYKALQAVRRRRTMVRLLRVESDSKCLNP